MLVHTAAFCEKPTLGDVISVFESLNKKGFGTCLTKDGRLFFRINVQKALCSHQDVGLTKAEVEDALNKASRVPDKYLYLEGTTLFILSATYVIWSLRRKRSSFLSSYVKNHPSCIMLHASSFIHHASCIMHHALSIMSYRER